jgi:hypothetical protein
VPFLDHLQVLIQSRSITVSNCISKFTQSWPPSVHSYGHEMFIIMSSKCISKLAQSHPQNVSPNMLHGGLPIRTSMALSSISTLAWFGPPSSQNYGRQVHIS